MRKFDFGKIWVGDLSLCEQFPQLCRLCLSKNVTIKSRIVKDLFS